MIQQKDLSGKVLAQRIAHYIKRPELVTMMGINAAKQGKPDAARKIVDDCLIRLGK